MCDRDLLLGGTVTKSRILRTYRRCIYAAGAGLAIWSLFHGDWMGVILYPLFSQPVAEHLFGEYRNV